MEGLTGALCLYEALCPVTLVVAAQTPSMSLEALTAQGLPLPPGPGESHVLEVGLMISSGIQCPFPSLGLISGPPGSSRARNHGEMDTPPRLPQCGQDGKLLPWKSRYWARTLS